MPQGKNIRSIRTIRVQKKYSAVNPTTDETDLTDMCCLSVCCSNLQHHSQSTRQQNNIPAHILLTPVNTFPILFQEKYFFSFIIPPFHPYIVTTLVIRGLCLVELRVEYGWNYMKFHP